MKKPEITLGKYLVSDDKLIAALPDLLEALESIAAGNGYREDMREDAKQALIKAGYTFD